MTQRIIFFSQSCMCIRTKDLFYRFNHGLARCYEKIIFSCFDQIILRRQTEKEFLVKHQIEMTLLQLVRAEIKLLFSRWSVNKRLSTCNIFFIEMMKIKSKSAYNNSLSRERVAFRVWF